MRTSIFDLFRIGIGPSSSHTVGPMRAARAFALALEQRSLLPRTSRMRADLYGSLALTGMGHGTDRAILLGLSGEAPESVDPARVEPLVAGIRQSHTLVLLGRRAIAFDPEQDVRFHKDMVLPGHPNAVRFSAYDAGGNALRSETYFSIGGGFIVREGAAEHAGVPEAQVPYPFSSGDELLAAAERAGLPIWRLVLANEQTLRSEAEIRKQTGLIWEVMRQAAARGLAQEGILPGGLNVRRRARRFHEMLLAQGETADPLAARDWDKVFAMAVSEENAAGGRVVTAPTNGAAGVIPAVLHYYLKFMPGTWSDAPEDALLRFFLTAGAIGILYKENASISGAEVGCQGEVGVACSMAAGGLVSLLEGTNAQVEHAAEIGMEHHLGMTCDPIGGLVQIPCIERNAVGAVKAINACRMAMKDPTVHKVSLDQVIHTMYQTGLDMQSRYKETSLAGLAVSGVKC